MIIVTGATGQLGQAIVDRLLKRVPAAQVGVSVRSPERAHPLGERGVRVRHGDFLDAASLRHAFEGASQVLIVSTPVTGEVKLRQHRTAIDAAKAAGAQRILYTSHMGSSSTSLFAAMLDHAATEAMLQESGVAFTSLRNGFYAVTGLMLIGQALETGEIAVPPDGPVSWVAHADLAEAAVIALTDPGRLDGLTPPLTGPEALDYGDIAAIASELTGRRITRITLSDEEYQSSLVARGIPEADAEVLVGVFAASRQGEFAAVDPALPRLIARSATPMRDVLAAHVSR